MSIEEAIVLLSDKKYVKYKNEIIPIFDMNNSIYKGVHIIWDEDYDYRICQVIEECPEELRWWIYYMYENQGGLDIYTDAIGYDLLFEHFKKDVEIEDKEHDPSWGSDSWCVNYHIMDEKQEL